MVAVIERVPSSSRRRHQRVVAALLDDIASRRERLYLLQARGARPAGLRALKAELQAARDELAVVVQMRSASG